MNIAVKAKYLENNAELAKALVESRKVNAELLNESYKYRRDFVEKEDENHALRQELSLARKTIFDLFKKNVDNYTEVIHKLGITRNSSSRSISTSSGSSSNRVQRRSINGMNNRVTESKGIVPKVFPSKLSAANKSAQATTSTVQPASDEEAVGRPNAELVSQTESMHRASTATTSSAQECNGIGRNGKNQYRGPVPEVIIVSCSNSRDDELYSSHAHSNNNVKRSPIGRKMNYDEEVNTSLRELKEKQLYEKLSPVPDESNPNRKISTPTKGSTVHNATQRTAKFRNIAQQPLSDLNKEKSPTNQFKSPKNNAQNEKEVRQSTLSPNVVPQKATAQRPTIRITNSAQQAGEGTSGISGQCFTLGDQSKVRSHSNEEDSSRNKEQFLNPMSLLKKLEQSNSAYLAPIKFFTSPTGNIVTSSKSTATSLFGRRNTHSPRTASTSTNSIVVSDGDFGKSPHVDGPNDLSHNHQINSRHTQPIRTENDKRQKTMAIEPIKKSNHSMKQSKLNIGTSNEINKNKFIINDNSHQMPISSQIRRINKLAENKENVEATLTSKSLPLQQLARGPLKPIQSSNLLQVSNKASEKFSMVRNVMSGSKSANHEEEDLGECRARFRTRFNENVSIDEQPNGRASNSRSEEHSTERHSDDSHKRRPHSKTRSRDSVSIAEQQSCPERPRRHVSKANYAEPKLNTKMRRNF